MPTGPHPCRHIAEHPGEGRSHEQHVSKASRIVRCAGDREVPVPRSVCSVHRCSSPTLDSSPAPNALTAVPSATSPIQGCTSTLAQGAPSRRHRRRARPHRPHGSAQRYRDGPSGCVPDGVNHVGLGRVERAARMPDVLGGQEHPLAEVGEECEGDHPATGSMRKPATAQAGIEIGQLRRLWGRGRISRSCRISAQACA